MATGGSPLADFLKERGFTQKLFVRGVSDPGDGRASQPVVEQREIGVGDASHRSVFVQRIEKRNG
jgi:hypothetical protein